MILSTLLLVSSVMAGPKPMPPLADDNCKTTVTVEFGNKYALHADDIVELKIGSFGPFTVTNAAANTSATYCMDEYNLTLSGGITVFVTRTEGDTHIEGQTVFPILNDGMAKRRFYNSMVISQTQTEVSPGELMLAQDPWMIDMTTTIEHHPRRLNILLVANSTQSSDRVPAQMVIDNEVMATFDGLTPNDGIVCSFDYQPGEPATVKFITAATSTYPAKGSCYETVRRGNTDFALPVNLSLSIGPEPRSGHRSEEMDEWSDTVDGVATNPTLVTITEAGQIRGVSCAW